MQGDDAVAAAVFNRLRLERGGLETGGVGARELVGLEQHIVDHHMADVVDRRLALAFAPQVGDGARLGDEEVVGDAVGDEAVDFLGHRHVAAAQAGFDVGDGNVELLGDDRAGQRGVDVANDEHERGRLGDAQFLEREHDLGRLGRVAAAAGAHEQVGLGDAEFFEEDVVHFTVVVLARVDDLERQRALGLERAHDRGDLHEVRSRTGDEINSRHAKILSDDAFFNQTTL